MKFLSSLFRFLFRRRPKYPYYVGRGVWFMRCDFIMALLIVALVLPGCGAVQYPAIMPGDVLPVGAGQVIYGVSQALASKPATTILADPTGRYFLVAWPCAGQVSWAFVTIEFESFFSAFGGGNISTVDTWNELRASLDLLKWTPVGAGAVLETLGARTVAVISRAIPVPLFVFTNFLVDPTELIRPMVLA